MQRKEIASATDQLGSMSLTESSAGSTKATDKGIEKFCSYCGKAGIAGDTLKKCSGCRCVFYCNVSCQMTHRKEHKYECREIKCLLETGEYLKTEERFSERIDDGNTDCSLFAQPPPTGECPICMYELPRNPWLKIFLPCCGKSICFGCKEADKSDNPSCPFCRTPAPRSNAAYVQRLKKSADSGNTLALKELAIEHAMGHFLPRNDEKALRLLHKAVAIDESSAACALFGQFYCTGDLGLEADEAKGRKYLEIAAKCGDMGSRFNLGNLEHSHGNVHTAIRHWRIAAFSGHSQSAGQLILQFAVYGNYSLADLAESLQARDKSHAELRTQQRTKALQALKDRGEEVHVNELW